MKRPAFQFYPADWRTDNALQSCSIAARGVWHELLCVMHEAKPYGHLVLNGKPMSDASAARLIGVPVKEYLATLHELEAADVFSRLSDGTIFSRRMVKDERFREQRAACGKLGGNPALLGEKDKVDLKVNLGAEDKVQPKLPPTPSSASAFASELQIQKHAFPLTPTTRPRDTPPFAKGMADKSSKVNGKHSNTWQSPEWVSATAKTFGIEARPNEAPKDFADRVHSEAENRKRQARRA